MITFDFENKSYANLKKVGAWVYSLHPTTEIICAAYGIDEEPIQTWWPGKKLEGVQAWPEDAVVAPPEMPYDLYCAIVDGVPIEAHNVAFEKAIWKNICVSEFGWAEPDPRQWRDTQAVASYYSMPPALDKLANALGYEGKNKDGGRLISKYSKLHLKTALDIIPPEDFKKFVKYCVDDVLLEQAVSDELGDLPEEELEVFFLDQEINLRGIPLDEKSIRDASAIVDQRSAELAEEFRGVTGLNPTQRDRVKDWFEDEGLALENLQADYLEEVLENEHGHGINSPKLAVAKRMLQLRLQHSKASTRKLDAMLRQKDHEGRARFQCKYHGAGPGRWTGTGFQPLNLSKGFEKVPPDQMIADISLRDPKWLDIMYGDAMDAVGKASRHHIRAKEGHRIIAGDYVSIEAVLLACTAGEEWKIEAFRRGDPLYELMGCKIHNLDEDAVALAMRDKDKFKEVFPAERFDGKTGELAFGYQGGLGAWYKFDSSGRHTDEAINGFKDGWRGEHPATKAYWFDLDEASIEAVAFPGRKTYVRGITFQVKDEWLSMRLINGKHIWYRNPELRMAMPPWHKPNVFNPEDESTWLYEDCADGSCDCRPRRQLTYMAQKEGRWRRVSTYGGKLTENATQGLSREMLVPAMFRLRKYGYPIILTVYDEIIAEVPFGKGSVEEFQEIMAETPGWAGDWPIRVDAWEGDRYRK